MSKKLRKLIDLAVQAIDQAQARLENWGNIGQFSNRQSLQ